MKKILLLFLLICCIQCLYAQNADSLAVADTLDVNTIDSLVEEEKTGWLKRDYPNPKKALIAGLVLPGSGQIYNKSWWKLPLVYGALVGMGLTIDYNQGRFRRLRTALDLKREGEEHEFSNTTLDNLQTLKNLRDDFDKNTQLAYVGFVLVYALQAVEAFVDSHLSTFDVEENIGFRLKPEAGYIPTLGVSTIGIGVSIPLNGKSLLTADSQHNNPFHISRP